MVLLAGPLSAESEDTLVNEGWEVRRVDAIQNPGMWRASGGEDGDGTAAARQRFPPRFWAVYTKLAIFNMTEYSRGEFCFQKCETHRAAAVCAVFSGPAAETRSTSYGLYSCTCMARTLCLWGRANPLQEIRNHCVPGVSSASKYDRGSREGCGAQMQVLFTNHYSCFITVSELTCDSSHLPGRGHRCDAQHGRGARLPGLLRCTAHLPNRKLIVVDPSLLLQRSDLPGRIHDLDARHG